MKNVNEKMFNYGNQFSVIRNLFEDAQKLKQKIGKDNVFDFSIGNPSAPLPQNISDDLIYLLNTEDKSSMHSYTNSTGFDVTRIAIAKYYNDTYNSNIDYKYIYMTCGASAALAITFNALYEDNDEMIVLSPYFSEYKSYIETAGYKLVEISPLYDTFGINIEELKQKINEKTKAVILNNPNNPTGVVYSEKEIKLLVDLLNEKQKEFNKPIYIISDEPYRDIVYDNNKVEFLPDYYDNSIVTFSYSKSLSLPGERIGYILLSNNLENKDEVFTAIKGAGRALGYVCAPTSMQKLVARHQGESVDINIYKKNRDVLCSNLKKLGFEFVEPQGAFYLFMKCLEKDDNAFSEKAKQFNLFLVPSTSFNCKGYVRISYCVPYDTIIRSIEQFKKLKESYK